MQGETDLGKLLASASPQVNDGEFVFLSFLAAQYGDHAHLQPVASIREAEGLTLVVNREVADQYDMAYQSVFKSITLQIHSSLEAVGLTAAFANALADQEISANVIAGFYHDHIFVPRDQVEVAVQALTKMSEHITD